MAALVSTLIDQRVEATTRPGWNLTWDEVEQLTPEQKSRGWSTDPRQIENEPLQGIVRTIAFAADGFAGDTFVFHIEADDGRLIVKTSAASIIRVVHREST